MIARHLVWAICFTGTIASSAPAAEEIYSMRIRLGVTDSQPRSWNGALSVESGELLRLEAWHFLDDDSIDGSRWKTSTRIGRLPDEDAKRGIHPPILRPGVLLRVRATTTTEMEVSTTFGKFRFAPTSVQLGMNKTFLDGAVVVERLPVTHDLGWGDGYEDFSRLSGAPAEPLQATWITFDPARRADSIRARRLVPNPTGVITVTPNPGDIFQVDAAAGRDGSLWFVWSEQVNGNWDLYCRTYDAKVGFSAVEKLTSSSEPDIFHKLCRDSVGNLYLAWMGFRDGQSDVFIRRYDGQAWSPERRVSTSEANDWEPALAADSTGRVFVAWDSYARGNYDIALRQIDPDEWATPDQPLRHEPVWITESPTFEAHPSLAIDRDDRVWLAWDEAGPAWGKDSGWFVKGRGTTLYSSRGIRVACYQNGKLSQPADVYRAIPEEFHRYVELPALAVDGGGRLWLTFRHRASRFKESGLWNWSTWELYATCLLGDRWLPAVYIPDSNGRNDMRTSLAAGPDGTMIAAWATDSRSYAELIPKQTRVKFAALAVESMPTSLPVLEPFNPHSRLAKVVTDERWMLGGMQSWTETSLEPAITETDEPADLERVRKYRYRVGDKTYRILRGDTHRHTDISYDGANDGGLEDCYRYALDAASLDFLAVTDHSATGGSEIYSWWRTQKYADLFHLPARFLPLYSYERSVSYPNGHRNVLLPRRGIRPLDIDEAEQKGDLRTGSVLYGHLQKEGGIDLPHTTASGMGLDWTDYDPTVEPVVELYSGFWYSSEHPDAPKTRPEMNKSDYRFRPGFVWNAWAKGYKLGVEASSDHISTHLSLACALVERPTRAGIFDAFRKRRTYAASANILLDVRITDQSGEHLMGEAFEACGPTQLIAIIMGTTPLRRVEIIKNNQFVYVQQRTTSEVRFSWTDEEIAPGDSYYYVRVEQTDDNIAWSSPIWVKYPERQHRGRMSQSKRHPLYSVAHRWRQTSVRN